MSRTSSRTREGARARRGAGAPAPAPARAPGRRRTALRLGWPLAVVLAALGAFLIAKQQARSGSPQIAPPPVGLPHTPDYHTLSVDPAAPRHLLLGTHAGLYESRDGGRSWRSGGLGGRDAMTIVRLPGGTVWAAGHYVLARSADGGVTWEEARPAGLPDLDVHGFAAAPDGRLYAAVADQGLYVSRDGGETFSRVSSEVGGGVYGLVAGPGGRLLAADPERGILRSADGGSTWSVALAAPAIGLAASPSDPDRVLAAGTRLWRSSDGGASWSPGFDPGEAVGPVAWSPAERAVAYLIVPGRRLLYRSGDGGRRWSLVR
jgi:photosystem II stability/assembly factor-like uncharacterized protein